jgi:hypothetical protein
MSRDDVAWRATAAYLYVLELDPSQLAWEYLRRNQLYCDQWKRRELSYSCAALAHWGLQFR